MTLSSTGFIGQKAWADRLGVSVRTFRRWRESGLIPLPDCVAPGNPRWSMELVNRTTLRRRNGAFQSHSARFVQEQGSAKGSRLSPQDVGVRHADSVGASGSGEQSDSFAGNQIAGAR